MFRSVARLQAKEIRFGMNARRSMQRGVTRSVAAIATTLGPKGRNVIIEQAYGAPKITKDGVTVARAIEFEDRYENMGAQLVKNVCNQTNDLAGDGTTTSAVLVDSIFGEGLKCIAQGTNPIDMKRGMDIAVDYIQTSLLKQARPVSGTEDIVRVATISSNGDAEIGRMVGDAMEKVGRDGVITARDGNTMVTELEVVDGMRVERGYLSPYFMTEPKALKAELDDALVLVYAKKLSSIQTLLPALNYVAQNNKPLLIIADDVEGEALTTLILNRLQGKLKVLCVKAPGFGDTKSGMLEDIAIFTGATLIGAEGTTVELTEEDFDAAMLGSVKKVTATKDETVLLSGGGEAATVMERVELLRSRIVGEAVEYNREKFQERLAKLTGGVAVIKVGGASETEVSEKKDRVVDAVCATRAAVQEGIVAGGGTALLRASLVLDSLVDNEKLTRDQRTGVRIVRNAIRLPAMKIASNAGKEGAVIVERILEQADPNVGYDAATDKYVDMFAAGIIDPCRVTQVALSDAVSVAGLMMTAEAAIVQAPTKAKSSDAKAKKDLEDDEEDMDLGLY